MEDTSLPYTPLIQTRSFTATLPASEPLEAARTARTTPAHRIHRSPLQALARKLVLAKLANLREGEIELADSMDGGRDHFLFGRATEEFPVRARVDVRSASFYTRMAFGGSIGAAEAYMSGAWTTDDLTSLVRILVRNREALDGMEKGPAKLLAPLNKLYHTLRDNSLSGSRRNIEAHYDLGNDFYSLFLDESMMYSAAIFEPATSSLEEASRAKVDRICRKLDLRPSDHLIEIGTGWGAFAIHAATHYGCRVTTTTISRRQFEHAVERVKALGLSDRITVLFEDYRELRGTFDKLVSIEMIEAVGHAYYDEFFSRCSKLLKPDGLMALQAITIADQIYEQALQSVDFIQRYIFPGSTIPSVTAICTSVARSSELRVVHHEDLTPHYARTLAEWRRRFLSNLPRVRELGYSERFIRMWEFYLCYCEGGFAERSIGSVQMMLAKPRNRSTPLLGVL